MSLSVFFDLTTRRIPNWLILFGLGAGLALNFYRGEGHLYYSIVGFVVGVIVFIPPFSLGWIGAGDVKCFGMIGAILGSRLLPRVFFYSAVVGGAMALASVLLGQSSSVVFRRLLVDWKVAMLTRGRVLPEAVKVRAAKGAHSLPWGVALGAGTILAYFVDRQGYWVGF